jgi:hypothetical protein
MHKNEYHMEKIGETLDMPGEKEQLKSVPKKSWTGDNRRLFFTENANSQKYYYMPIGDIPQHPHRNTLVPLGTFLGFDGTDTQYYMRFSNPPYNNSEHSHISMNTNPLVYTDYPPVDETIPLTYTDYLEQFAPGILQDSIIQGRPLISGDGITGFGVSSINGGKKQDKSKNRTMKNTQKSKNRKTKNTRKYKKRRGNNK